METQVSNIFLSIWNQQKSKPCPWAGCCGLHESFLAYSASKQRFEFTQIWTYYH